MNSESQKSHDELMRELVRQIEEKAMPWPMRPRMTPDEYLAFLLETTEGEPPSREVSPLDATPFEL